MLTQQAVEKAIRAVLAARGTEFPFIHDLEKHKEFAGGSGIDLPATLDGIEALTRSPPTPARSLYASAGFAPCELFGDYRLSPNSTYMTMRVRGQARR